MKLPERYTRLRLPLVLLLVALICWLHFRLGPDKAVASVFLQDFYFLPIILSGFWWGPWIGLIMALVVSALYAPYVVLVHHLTPPTITAAITQMVLFLAVGLLVGWLRRREQAHEAQALRAENLAAVGRAVASVAHDMKTPLMAIGGFTAQVKRNLEPGCPEEHKLEVVIEQTARLEGMVKEMLDFSRPLELHRQSLDLKDLAGRTMEVAASLAEQHQVRLTSDLEEGLPLVEADPERLQEALINLLNNAVQASPAQGEVSLSAWRQGEEVVLAVSDHGPGVSPAQRQHLFTPFYTTKKEGTGLGLPVVHKVAEAHGGRLEIGDNHPHGAVFRLVLPLQGG
ncbi:MAG: ATP-binding protein [Pseudomonadota bacterium]